MHGVLSYLQALEAESLHILCEVAAEFARLVMLYSVGKDSSALLRLARKAFYPGPIPFPLLHVNTTYKSPEMLAFRDELALGGFDAAIGGAGSRRARGHAHSVRARRRWFDGTQEACGVFLAVAAELLRFVACGSLDDGKSTLIGRLLNESRGVYEDQLQAVRRATPAGCGQELELAFITDGLRAERQQGIAIDVAYRYFSTPRRKFIIADTPRPRAIYPQHGHRGLDRGPRAHSARRAKRRADRNPGVTPTSPRCWASRTWWSRSTRWTWWITGARHSSRSAPVSRGHNFEDLRIPVPYVIRKPDFRGYAGQVASRVVRPGDPIMVLPSQRLTRVSRLCSFDGDKPQAFPPMAVTVCLAD